MSEVFKGSRDYVASEDLMRAVNIAMVLRKPLLIKGEPGTGKTVLAEAISKALGKKQYALYDESNCSMTQGGDALRYGDYDEKTLRGYIETDKELLTQS